MQFRGGKLATKEENLDYRLEYNHKATEDMSAR